MYDFNQLFQFTSLFVRYLFISLITLFSVTGTSQHEQTIPKCRLAWHDLGKSSTGNHRAVRWNCSATCSSEVELLQVMWLELSTTWSVLISMHYCKTLPWTVENIWRRLLNSIVIQIDILLFSYRLIIKTERREKVAVERNHHRGILRNFLVFFVCSNWYSAVVKLLVVTKIKQEILDKIYWK